jgi:hypothetical protein
MDLRAGLPQRAVGRTLSSANTLKPSRCVIDLVRFDPDAVAMDDAAKPRCWHIARNLELQSALLFRSYRWHGREQAAFRILREHPRRISSWADEDSQAIDIIRRPIHAEVGIDHRAAQIVQCMGWRQRRCVCRSGSCYPKGKSHPHSPLIIPSTIFFASPNNIIVLSRKNSSFSTPA